MRTEILYEDKSIMVVRKPAGLAVQSAGIGQPDVVSELKSYLAKLPGAGRPGKGEPYLGIVHRLDQPVEGLLVFAKDKKAAAASPLLSFCNQEFGVSVKVKVSSSSQTPPTRMASTWAGSTMRSKEPV